MLMVLFFLSNLHDLLNLILNFHSPYIQLYDVDAFGDAELKPDAS